MGILNVTPDSFSDGGRWDTAESAIARGRELVVAGADIVDIGGESTRPGAQRVSPGEELQRVLPVVTALAADGIAVSIDTMRAEVASQAVAAGATIINDVSGGRADPHMLSVMAEAGTRVILMHWRAHSTEMNDRAQYDDVVAEVCAELSEQIDRALAVGVDRGKIVIDPGLGFAKNAEHNWALLRRLDDLKALGFPVLVGASRKRFLGELLADDAGLRPVEEREAATVALSTLAAQAGMWGVRVHEPWGSADALRVVARIHEEM